MPLDELTDNVTMYKTTLRKLYAEKNLKKIAISIARKVCRGRQDVRQLKTQQCVRSSSGIEDHIMKGMNRGVIMGSSIIPQPMDNHKSS